MLHKIIVIALVGIFCLTADVLAGGAVQRRRSGAQMQQQRLMQQQQQQIQMQRRMMQQKAMQDDGQQRLPDEVMDFDALWEGLAVSSEIWPRLIDQQIKNLIVVTYIDWYREQGVMIKKSPAEYVILLDSMGQQDVSLLQRPFQDVLRVLAIMEYDFDNGMNKDQMALKVLGKELYEQNRKRLGR